MTVPLWWFLGGVFLGVNVGLILAAWLHNIARDDINLTAIRALRAVRQENGGLSAQTSDIVNDALLEHEDRWGA